MAWTFLDMIFGDVLIGARSEVDLVSDEFQAIISQNRVM